MSQDVSTQRIDYSASGEHEEENSWALFALAWRRKWIVVFLMALGLGLGYLFYVKQTPIYQSSSKIFIVRDPSNGPGDGIDVSDSYDTVHETLLRSPAVLQIAIETLDIPSMPSLSGLWIPYDDVEDDKVRARLVDERNLRIARRMMGRLSVEVGSNISGDILAMSYKSEYAADCSKALFAIFEAYRTYQSTIYGEESAESAEMFREYMQELAAALAIARSEYSEFLNQTELSFDGQAAENPHLKRARETEEELGRRELRYSQLKTEIEGYKEAIADGLDQKTLNLLIRRPGSDEVTGPETPMPDRLFELQKEKQRLTQKFAADHPKVREVEDEIRMTLQFLQGTTTTEDDNYFEAYLAAQHRQLKIQEDQIAILKKKYADEDEKAKQLTDAHVREQQLRHTVQDLREEHSAAVEKLRALDIVKASSTGTQVELIDPPTDGFQVEPDLMTAMVTAGLLGMLVGLCLAYAVDRADSRFHSPDEIRADLGIPVVGHIPVLPGLKKQKKGDDFKPGELSPALRTFYHPRGRIAEAYRAVRTALYFSTRGSGHQVIQVTSPSPGDGKSTLSGNLALSIANSGKKALLIDADFRRPRIHRLFGLDNSQGISTVIEGKAEIMDAVQMTEVENLSIMSCGPRPENPSELLSSKRFAELLDILRDQYDLVIVDTPPVLAVTDPLNVVPRVDAVLLVLRLTKNSRAMGRRALEALDGMGANVSGIVINGVANQGSGYGYGYGKYGYDYGGKTGGYRYGYGADSYDYRYSDGDDRTYYEEDVALPSRRSKASNAADVAQAK